VVLTSKLSSKFSIGYNGTVNQTKAYLGSKKYEDSKSWWGSALYLNVDPTSNFGLTLRGEYFSDKNGLKMFSGIDDGGSIFATTLSALFKIDNLTFIPEFRLDKASKEIFIDSDSKLTKTSSNILFAAIYSF
jgi:hypothetical protein